MTRGTFVSPARPPAIYAGDPMKIPCVETSDAAHLCRHPLVSVCMLAYNHAPYVRQAIEGVMMQKTDFEFELVIGEDCSTDGTREICFELQRRFPDKIRVLWSDENLYRKPGLGGGNSLRVRARCRGEFVAYCEGDDYWTDPQKLQLQVDVMRRHPEVSFCCHKFRSTRDGAFWTTNQDRIAAFMSRSAEKDGFLFTREEFFEHGTFAQTATVMYRKSLFDEEYFKGSKSCRDLVMMYASLRKGLGFYLDRTMSVYRMTDSGVWAGLSARRRAEADAATFRTLYEADPCALTRKMYRAARLRLLWQSFPFSLFAKVCRRLQRIAR
jgi:glycosyltransferase involved in cell wall biosynthesis